MRKKANRLESAVLVRVSRAEHEALRKLARRGVVVAGWIRARMLDGLAREGIAITEPVVQDERQSTLGFPNRFFEPRVVQVPHESPPAEPTERVGRRADPKGRSLRPAKAARPVSQPTGRKRSGRSRKAGKRRVKRGR